MIALALRYWYVVAIAALMALLGVQTVRVAGAKTETAQARTELANDRTRYAQAAQAAEAAARLTEQTWQAHANQIEADKNEQIRAIDGQLDAALTSLRNRSERTARSNLPATASACQGGTGTDLSRSDAEFLSREATRADRLRTALAACYQAAEAVK